MRTYAFLTLSLTLPYVAFSQVIETARLKVTLKQGAALEVVDKKASVTWHQSPKSLAVEDVRTAPDELSFTLDHRLQVRIKASGEVLDETLSGDLQTSIEGLEYPAGFVLADAAHQSLVLPKGSGLVIPFSMKDAPYLRTVMIARYIPL
ncbi:MAG: hypothetical protein ABSH56_13235 [Bryobacteraceae bacterium]|jgi:hypothetical protein